VSKQLTLSAAVSVIAMAAFAVYAANTARPTSATGAPTEVAALQASLPAS
jgi:hypothetical protein